MKINTKKTITIFTACLAIISGGLLLFFSKTSADASLGAPNLFADPLSSASIQLSWSVPSSDAVSYKVFRGGSEIATTAEPYYRDTGLSPDTNYQYQVVAYDAGGNSSPPSAAVNSKTFHDFSLPDNLTAYWKFDESSGSAVHDVSGNGHDGALTDGASWTSGKRGGAVALNGLNGRVQEMGNDGFSYTGGDMSISLWYWADSTDSDSGEIISKPWNGNGQYNYYLTRNVNGTITLQLAGATAYELTTTSKLNMNAWNHIAVTVASSKEVKIYLNNVLDASSIYNISNWTPSAGIQSVSLLVGCLYPYGSGWSGNTTFCVKGKLENVRIYSDILSSDEINEMFSIEKRENDEPAVFFSNITEGEVISGNAVIGAEVIGDTSGVQFKLGKSVLGSTGGSPPYRINWNSASVPNGYYAFVSTAAYGSGQSISAESHKILVSNGDGVAVQVVSAISGTKILPDDVTLPGTPSGTLTATAARGEFEPASFVLRSQSSALGNVDVSVSNLQKGSDSISSEDVDIKAVKAWYQSGSWAWTDPSQSDDRYPNLVPELLLNNDGMVIVDRNNETNSVKLSNGNIVGVSDPAISSYFYYTIDEFPVRDADSFQAIANLPAGEAKQFWLTVHVPDDAKSGIYSGTVNISSGGNTLRTLDFRVTVPDFDLANSNIENNIYYTGQLNPPYARISYSWKSEEQYRAELIDLKNHGIKYPTIYRDQTSPYFEQELAIRRELGMNGGPLYALGGNPAAFSDTSDLESKIPGQLDLVHSYGFTDYYLYGKDEATGEILDGQRASWTRARELGAKVFVAGSGDAFDHVGDILDLLVSAWKKDPDYADQWHSEGHKIYSYADPQGGAENPQLYRRNYGVVLWAAGYDGAMDFAYNANYGRPWNDFDSLEVRDENFVYPTMNGVVDTIAWEGYREANDDNRYIATLENAIALGLKSSDPGQRSAAEDAQNYLDNLRSSVLSKAGNSGNTADFAIDLDAMRLEIVQKIDAIGRISERPADINQDAKVNMADFDLLKTDFLKLAANLANPRSDINGDGQATVKDVGIMMSDWAP